MKSLTKTLAFATAIAGCAVSQAQTFSDTTFNNSDWSAISFTQGTTSFTAGQVSLGNPDTGRQVTHDLGDTTAIGVAHVFNPASVTIGTGGMAGLTYQIDFIVQPFAPVGLGFLVVQNGRYYISNYLAATQTQWTTAVSDTLTESMFGEVNVSLGSVQNMNSSPDFDLVGSTLQFGFFTANSGGPIIIQSNYDNFSVSAEAVPEPATMALLAIPALAALRKKKSR
ncbi:hypothetical protein CCB80_07950 [Armatimonadetes bacterium Uphvl-Ar1]|nr:hypothetical protein CCB80_07950 [Armatimonadetes bacterium Uphvl-Ar1]